MGFVKNITFAPGELAEWSNAVVLKTIDPSRGPGVRIPYSPQKETHNGSCGFCFLWRNQTCLIFDIKNKTLNPRQRIGFLCLLGIPFWDQRS